MSKLKELTKKAISHAGVGFCYGIGISVSVGIIVFVADYFEYKIQEKNFSARVTEFSEKDFEIASSKLVINDENYVGVAGTIINKSEFEQSRIEIEAEFFNNEGIFVYECMHQIENKLEPLLTENFLIKCGVCNKTLPQISSYKLKVTDSTSYKKQT